MKFDIKSLMIAGLAACLIVLGFQWGANRATKKAMQLLEQNYKTTIQRSNDAIKKLTADNVVLHEQQTKIWAQVVASEERAAVLKADISAERQARLLAEQKLLAAPPESLVATAKELLNTSDIWLNKERVEFAITPFRDAVIRLNEHKSFKFIEIPKLLAQIAEANAQKDSLKLVISSKDQEIANWAGKYTAADEKFQTSDRTFKMYIQSTQKSFLGKAFDLVLKVGFGYALASLLTK